MWEWYPGNTAVKNPDGYLVGDQDDFTLVD